MAYNEILAGRLNRFLQKYLSMKGDAPSVQLAADWQPGLLWDASETDVRYLQGWNRYGVATALNAIVGQVTGFRIRNPSTSNGIVVVEKISMDAVATDLFSVSHGPTTADLATLVATTLARLDPRGNPQPFSVPSVNTAALPSLSTTIMAARALANTAYEVILTDDQEIPILPGDALQFQGTTANQGLDVTVVWRERFLEESERQ